MSATPVILAAPLLAALLDRAFGEPRNALHPVAGFGALAKRVGAPLPALAPPAALCGGALAWALLVGGVALLAAGLQAWLLSLPAWAALPLLALALKPALAWRMLHDEVAAVETALARDLPQGRAQVARLCSRDVSRLDATGVRETALETLAENLNDAWVAPLFWFAVAGLPGAWAWRAANTLDAMWGYRGRWEWAGRCAARADDLLAWLPARLTALLLGASRGLRAEAARTPSPNGGWPMAALALRLGLRLRKSGAYELNAGGRAPQPADTAQALRLCTRAAWLAVGWAVVLAAAVAAAAALRNPGAAA